ncbi:hypothetical protein [Streptomyces sp. JNUCC 63]
MRELRKEALNVRPRRYRRAPQAVADHDGAARVNRNVLNGVKSVLSVIGNLPIGMPMAFEAAYGWGWVTSAGVVYRRPLGDLVFEAMR